MNTGTKKERVIVKRGYSTAQDEAEAVGELASSIQQSNSSVTLLFASSNYNLNRLGEEIKQTLEEPVIGCTTSGEITPLGYARNSLSGASIASDELRVFTYLLPSLRQFETERVEGTLNAMKEQLSKTRIETPEARAFGLLLIDGLSLMEERVAALFGNVMEDLAIAGGSAGDDLKLETTYVYSDGKFVSNAAQFALFVTTLPFKVMKTQHFTASEKRLVITKADPEKRIVYEINGRPAAEEYARVIGMEIDELKHFVYFTSPLMLRVGGENYVRSIQKVNDDGSLTFFSAIDEGLVLRVAERKNLVDNLQDAFNQVKTEVPHIKLTIGFDCILRRLEVMDTGLQEEVNEILKKNNVIGFSTYGEQFKTVHINQTFTGIVLGE